MQAVNQKIVELKEEVYKANIELVKQGLVIYTWGNVSAIDRETNRIVIKPSGVDYDTMKPEDMVVLDLEGNIIEGNYKPSSDTPTHLALYKAYDTIGSVVHTHSEWATSWAQAGIDIPCYGTTHADYFFGKILCTRALTKEEIEVNYELNTGKVMIETMANNSKNPDELPGMIISNHGPFGWGKDAVEAVHNMKVMEEIAKMAYYTEQINRRIEPISQVLLDKHYLRKHGKNAYYGQ
ncbi:L-ribulose-5-phosphate 4-epimerase [Petrocella atlantisensis]|uniref:L-ribulose-5-phosphate 4-epimerase n=1 Tax=Petrocella atlantisensis TaxID=2173034 RepID=A0A3P7S2B6_9FIRM|nr:L-ribulose-5-phosphate 4-epimerase [Petrocella atlantisensis]PKM56202.1 MAG: L-ribulose-5-phosphate 4-epimerase [Firmicutes bacterium HGW-Firmicutes-5]VDN48792.1 L-ribulose-5-phosphate 4-epimerase [Petrocella atlantisensis]